MTSPSVPVWTTRRRSCRRNPQPAASAQAGSAQCRPANAAPPNAAPPNAAPPAGGNANPRSRRGWIRTRRGFARQGGALGTQRQFGGTESRKELVQEY